MLPKVGGSLLTNRVDALSRLRHLFNPLGLHLFRPENYPLEFRLSAGSRNCPPFETSALSRLNIRVHGLQFAPRVFDSHLPINASLGCVNIR